MTTKIPQLRRFFQAAKILLMKEIFSFNIAKAFFKTTIYCISNIEKYHMLWLEQN
jgi:hypothetical protein